jgi:hypothetical protein
MTKFTTIRAELHFSCSKKEEMKQQHLDRQISAELSFVLCLWGKALRCFADSTNLIRPGDV